MKEISSGGRKCIQAFFSPNELILTNDCLDEAWVQKLVRQIKENGGHMNHGCGSICVRMIPGQGYFVVDGNHFTEACRRAETKEVLGTVFTL